MTDQPLHQHSDETSLGGGPDTSQLAGPSLADAAVTSQLQTVLDLDELLSSARRPERTIPICTDGVALREYEDALRDLSQLVDSDGEVFSQHDDGDASLAEVAQATEANERAQTALQRVKAKTYGFLVRAMESDAFETWDRSQKDGQGKVKDQRRYENELIAQCAVSPPMDVTGVQRLRSTLGQAQVVALFNGAYYVNTRDGLDVPFSPSFLRPPKPKEQ